MKWTERAIHVSANLPISPPIVAIGVLTYLPLLLTWLVSETRARLPTSATHSLLARRSRGQAEDGLPLLSYDGRACSLRCNSAHADLSQLPRLIKSESPALEPMRTSFEKGTPLSWIKFMTYSDFVYFNHSPHVNKGVACVTCHGQVNEMEEVRHISRCPWRGAWSATEVPKRICGLATR
ncbi:MAG: hypothetical protein R3C56_34420 [Pirellulaceae bacterium]